MSYHATVDTIAARLHRDGWSAAVKYPTGCVWVVSGQRDGRWVVAETTRHKQALSTSHDGRRDDRILVSDWARELELLNATFVSVSR